MITQLLTRENQGPNVTPIQRPVMSPSANVGMKVAVRDELKSDNTLTPHLPNGDLQKAHCRDVMHVRASLKSPAKCNT